MDFEYVDFPLVYFINYYTDIRNDDKTPVFEVDDFQLASDPKLMDTELRGRK